MYVQKSSMRAPVRRPRHRGRVGFGALLTVVLGATAGALVPQAAFAAEAEVKVQEFTFTADQLAAKTRAFGNGRTRSATVKSRVRDHLDDQMRSGRLVDSAAVAVTEMANPYNADGQLTLVLDGSQRPSRAKIVRATHGKDQAVTGVGWETSDVEDAPAASVTPFGGGYLGATPNGMTTEYPTNKFNQGCSTFSWDGDGFQTAHKMTSCYEKWRKKGTGTREYVYNRWMLFTRGSSGSAPSGGWLKDLTIRSRQWSGQDRISTMTGFQPPTGSSTNCSDAATLSLNVNGVGISAPIKKCDYNTVLVDASTAGRFLIGLDRNGSTTAAQHRLDAAAGYIAKNGTDVPSFADYSWATTQWCSSVITCDPNVNWVQKDSGW